MHNYEIVENIDNYLNYIDYKVDSGDKFEWKCFGSNAWIYESSSKTGESSVTFDLVTKEVYEVIIFNSDYMYKWLNKEYIDAYLEECKERKINPDLLFEDDDRTWVLTDSFEDILDKTYAILNNRKFDSNVVIDIDFGTEEELEKIKSAALKANKNLDDFLSECIQLLLGKDTPKNIEETQPTSKNKPKKKSKRLTE